MAIEIGVHSWSFNGCDIMESSLITRAIGLNCMDLGSSADFDPPYIIEHVKEEAERFNEIKKKTGIRFVDAIPQFMPVYKNDYFKSNEGIAYKKQLINFFEFASCIGLDGITLNPGRINPCVDPEDGFKLGAEILEWAVVNSRDYGIKVRIEPHIQCVVWTPALALEMVRQVNGLSLTIDCSHFVFNAIPYEHIQKLLPYGSHWHARQARQGKLECKWESGQIDFSRIVSDLKAIAYNGVICMEYTNSPWMGMDDIDCISETIRLRDNLHSMI